MTDRSLPASPNWYCSRCSDVSSSGVLGVGARNVVYLIDVSASACRVTGQLVGHANLVSGFSFCQHAGQNHVCVSSSTDGSVRFWDSNSRTLIREQLAHQNPVSALHWSPVDKDLVVSGDEKGVVVCHWFHTGDAASFFPEPRTIVCLTCSPHTWSCVAVGYKDGMIVLVDVSKKGEVTHRLRGHDNEIHSLAWSPVTGEPALYSRAEDDPGSAGRSGSGPYRGDFNGLCGSAADGASAGERGCYLASGSKDHTVRIWSTAKGKGVMTLKLPFLKRRSSAVDPGVKERLWLSVHWPPGRPTELVSSCFSGELLLWDLTRGGKQRWTLFGSSAEGQNHNRIVFNTSSLRLQDGGELLLSTSMDREIKCWDLKTLSCCWTLFSLGGAVNSLTFSPVGAGCLALGVGDNMIRVWNTLSCQNQYDIRTFWQGVKSKVTALAWHPHKEGSLSFGTEDGKVGIYDVFSSKPPQISSSYHRKTVYTLAWGPAVPPLSFGSGGKQSFSLYSCAGEGVILQHDAARLSGEASDIDQLIKDTNSIKHKLSPHTDLSWKPDGTVVAIGNEDGSIDVFRAPDLKLLSSVQQHHKIINSLRWHHQHGSAPQLHALLASGSSNAIVYVHDLRSVIDDPPETPVVLTEPFRRLCGHTAKITGMAWSPHHSARLVTASYDGTAQVWDVLEEAAVSNYRGHVGYLLCVDWSPVDPDVVWTGGKDFTVQEWKVSQQEFTNPPKGKKMSMLQDKKKSGSKQKKKNRSAAGPGGDGVPKMNGDGEKRSAEQSEEEEEEARSTSSTDPPGASLEIQKKSSSANKSKEKPPDPGLLKKKKPRSMLPVSTAMDHRPREELLQDCIALAAVQHSAPPAGCSPGQGDHVHLGLFADRRALHRMLQAEEEGHVEAGHFDSVVYLRLWSGDLQGALQLATERGELNDHLLSVAPMAGFAAWSGAVEAYVRQLVLQEQYLKAASHLLSVHRVHEAVDLLRTHRLFREAVALAKARLAPDEPVLKELYASWAAVLEKDGHLSAAAKCHLAAGSGFDAAKVIAKKNDVASLRTAAGVARISGEGALAQTLALRCAKDLAAAHDWLAAQEVLRGQDNLLVHRLHLCTAELLTAALLDAGVIPAASCSSTHQWAEPEKHPSTIQDRVRDVWEEEFGVSAAEDGSVEALLQELRSVESPAPSASAPLKQVLLQAALHLSRGVLGWILDDDALLLTELWWAAAWIRDAGLFCASAEICRRMFPEGDVTLFSRKRPKTLKASDGEASDGEASAALRSLQAFVCYHRLYERWWRSATEPAPPEGEEDFGVLLSEPHAACQSVQRAVQEVQERLAAMVLQHSRAQGSDGGGLHQNPAENSSEDPETLLSLSSSMSKHQQQLLDLPDSLKAFPHPDVLECCLVLLHLSRCSGAVSVSLRQKAEDLLQKDGKSPAVLKASRRFVT